MTGLDTQTITCLPLTHFGEEAIAPRTKQTLAVRHWVRGSLVLFATGLVLLFITARWIDPYDANGQPLTMGSHTRLGMPPCEFLLIFHKPCPACGLTTSFALLLHGDVPNSLRANAVGTGMAVFGMALIPWCLYMAVQGRYLWVRSIERASLWAGGFFLLLLLIRWGIVLI